MEQCIPILHVETCSKAKDRVDLREFGEDSFTLLSESKLV